MSLFYKKKKTRAQPHCYGVFLFLNGISVTASPALLEPIVAFGWRLGCTLDKLPVYQGHAETNNHRQWTENLELPINVHVFVCRSNASTFCRDTEP